MTLSPYLNLKGINFQPVQEIKEEFLIFPNLLGVDTLFGPLKMKMSNVSHVLAEDW